MEFHPAADLFPMMTDAELDDLAADIRENGLHHAVVTLDGQILDGRNRFLACRKAEVEPRFEEWAGSGSPTAWVLSENLHRRHLSASQKATVAVEALPIFEAEARERQRLAAEVTNSRRWHRDVQSLLPNSAEAIVHGNSRDFVAASAGVASTQVGIAKSLLLHAPDLFEEVKRGDLTVNAAQRKATARGVLPKRDRKGHKPGKRVRVTPEGKVVRPEKPIPELESLPPMVADFIREFEANLVPNLSEHFPVMSWPELEKVRVHLRQRLIRIFEGKALTKRREAGTTAAKNGKGDPQT
jgi:ParB-like chromosome segregation protein Spo0J